MALDMTTALTISAKVTGTQALTGLTNGLNKIEGQTNKAAGAMSRLKAAAGSAMQGLKGVGIAAGVAVVAIGKIAKDNLDAADAMSKMSQRTGVAAPMLDKFRKVAELSDTSIESVGKGMKTLASNMADVATKGTGPAAEAFNALGIKVTDATGKLRDTDQVMLDVADKFQKMADGPEKAALAADIFGSKLGSELIPMLNSGGDAVRNMSTALTQEFADSAAVFNDRIENMQEKLGLLAMSLTEKLLPYFEKFLGFIEQAATWFGTLPQPVQDLAAGFAAVAIPLAAIAVPIGAVVGALSALAPIIGPVVALLTGPAGIVIAIGAVIAIAWQFRDQIKEAFMGAVNAVTGFFSEIAAIPTTFHNTFVQPVIDAAGQLVNWFATGFLAVFDAIKQPFMQAWEWYKTNFIDPVIQLGQQVVDWYVNTWIGIFDFIKQPFEQGWQWIQENFINVLQNAFQQSVQFIQNTWANMQQIISSPFVAAVNIVKGALNGIMGAIEGGINGAIGALNRLIAAANRIPGVRIPNVSPVQLPRFAEGGVVTGPTMALVGEGGEPEYIVPQSKAGAFAANWMAGVRGPSAIPRFAEGGMVVPSANVSIQTGPVTQMNGTNYVTTQDLSRAVQAGVNQTLNLIAGDGSVRRQLGIA